MEDSFSRITCSLERWVWNLKKDNSKKANIVLGFVICGFLISFPFKDSLLGGMAAAFFSASMIAGFADWFAVTALFRKPLRIPSTKYIRTEIIPRNQEKIFKLLIETVEIDLLNKETLKNKLNEYKVSELLLRYFVEHEVKEDLKRIITDIIQDMFDGLDPESVGELVKELVTEKSSKIRISPYLAEAIHWTMNNGYDEKVIDFIVDEFIGLFKTPRLKNLLADQIDEAITTYVKGMTRKKWLVKYLENNGFSSTEIAGFLQQELLKFLDGIKNPKHQFRKKIEQWIIELINKLRTDDILQQKIENWKNEQIAKVNLTPFIKEFLTGYQEAAAADSNMQTKWMTWIANQIDRLVNGLQHNENYQEKVDQAIKEAACNLLEKNHSELGKIVNESLSKYGQNELVEFIETKAGNDLQIIRINGSIIGGISGVLIFIILHLVS